jgi:A/G-specific adenine glycosylase
VSDSDLSTALLEWYQKNARDLPWRGQNLNPYRIWISEIMLQQTRVETVIPYFCRWMERFPSLDDLASATLQEVLGCWEGLGYYGRARNLHRTAQIIREEWSGRFPQRAEELRQLPGIGRYTAGAIASLAFNADEPALDGNVQRVLSRVFNIDIPARSPSGEKRLWQIARENLPPGKAGEYNQALMDLGAMICTPHQPNCATCPLKDFCQAFSMNLQEERPVRVKRPPIPHFFVTAAVIRRDDKVLITQRPAKGLLGGLWEFPGGKLQSGEDLVGCLKREILEELDANVDVFGQLGVYQHAYTHFRVTLHAFHCRLPETAQPHPVQVQDLRWVQVLELKSFPMGKIDRLIARDLQPQPENLC